MWRPWYLLLFILYLLYCLLTYFLYAGRRWWCEEAPSFQAWNGGSSWNSSLSKVHWITYSQTPLPTTCSWICSRFQVQGMLFLLFCNVLELIQRSQWFAMNDGDSTRKKVFSSFNSRHISILLMILYKILGFFWWELDISSLLLISTCYVIS